jgi:hypothetical protein
MDKQLKFLLIIIILVVLSVMGFVIFSCVNPKTYRETIEITYNNGDTDTLISAYKVFFDGGCIKQLKFGGEKTVACSVRSYRSLKVEEAR